MELHSGGIYKSPRYARQIRISSITDLGHSYELNIYWIDSDLDYEDWDQITVSKDDVKNWKLVKSNV